MACPCFHAIIILERNLLSWIFKHNLFCLFGPRCIYIGLLSNLGTNDQIKGE